MKIKLSSLIAYCLQNLEENIVIAVVIAKRTREVRLVIPAKYSSAFTKDLRIATVLKEELLERKTKYLETSGLVKVPLLKK